MVVNTIGNGFPQVMSMTPAWWGSASFYSGPLMIHPSLENQSFPTARTFVEGNLTVEAVTPQWVLEHWPIYHVSQIEIVGIDQQIVFPTELKIADGNIEVHGPTSSETTTPNTDGYTLSIG